MARIASVKTEIQTRNLCVVVKVGGKIVERNFYGIKSRFFREGDCPKTHGFCMAHDMAEAFAKGWRDEAAKAR